jgi:hypothetical protein
LLATIPIGAGINHRNSVTGRFAVLFAMAVPPGRKHDVDVGAIVRRKLHDRYLQQKFAAHTMGVAPASFCQALNGEPNHPLDLWKLLDLDCPQAPDLAEEILEAVVAEQRKKRMAKAILRNDVFARKAGA